MARAPNLPKDNETLAYVVNDHADREERYFGITWAKWDLFEAYLDGHRRFEGFDQYGGRVSSFFLTDDGDWQPQITELLASLNKVKGVFMSLDMWPHVTREDESIGSIRQRSTAQVIANAITSSPALYRTRDLFFDLFLKLGCAGIQVEVDDVPNLGVCADYEVVHPRELMPFPAIARNRTKLCGLVRQRWIPLDRLVDLYGTSVKRHVDKMTVYERQIGSVEDSPTPAPMVFYPSPKKPSGDSYLAVKLRELWVYGPRNTCAAYCATSFRHVLERLDYGDRAMPCALSMGRFIDNGTFHGAGYCDLLWSIVREFERLMKAVINNVNDLDRYPVTLIPAGVINEKKLMREDGTSLRFATYKPEHSFIDTSGRQLRPITISPHNAGSDVPGRTAAFLLSMFDRISLVGDIVRDKGRIDSLPALQYLDEQDKQPLTNAVNEAIQCFSGAHRYALAQSVSMLATFSLEIPVTRLDLGLLGAVIDFERGTVSFKDNPVPDVTRLKVGTRSGTTSSPALKKQEALSYLELGVRSPEDVILYFVKEGIESAMYSEGEINAHRTFVINALRLYGDGEQNQQIVITPHMSRPDLQLREVSDLMSSPELASASVGVQDDFIVYRETLMGYLQKFVPRDVPDPLDVALSGAPDEPAMLPP